MNGCINLDHTGCAYVLSHCYTLLNWPQGSTVQYHRLFLGIMQGWTPLHYAVAADCTEAIQLLVSAGAVNAQDPKVR